MAHHAFFKISVLLVVAWAGAVAVAACSSSKGPDSPDGGSSGNQDAAAVDGATGDDGGVPSPDAGNRGSGVTAGARWVGRVDTSYDAGPRFAWSGSGFVATVTGATISVKLGTVGASTPVFFQPVIDGDAGARFSVTGGDQTVALASNLPDAGAHTVELYRETEGRYGINVFEGFVDGVPGVPPASSGRLIEIVGDSITAGYGDLGMEAHPNYGPDPDGGCTFSTLTESAYQTYGMMAGRTLGADVSLVAVSGWGMYRDNNNSTSNVLPNVYANTLGLVATPPWSFQPEPQAVVINLGTNDFYMGDPGATQFEGAYTAFLGTLRAKYPDAWIFCAVGPLLSGAMLPEAQADIEAVVSAAQTAGDTKVQYLDFGQENASLGTGCQYHPNVAEHQMMATKLVSTLRLALGW